MSFVRKVVRVDRLDDDSVNDGLGNWKLVCIVRYETAEDVYFDLILEAKVKGLE